MTFWTLILPLRSVCRPTAIAGFVAAIIVLAVYGQIITIAVGKSPIAERFELLPFSAHIDAARTIVWPRDGFRIRAASFHIRPDAIEARRRFTESRQAVFRSFLTKRFELQASARFGNTISQSCSGRCEHISTITLAVPENSPLAVFTLGSTNHSKPAETLTAGNIDQIAFADCPSETSARPGARVHAQSITTSDFLIAAVANAQPRRFLSFAGRPAVPCNNAQIAKTPSHKIVGSRAIALSYRHADNVSDGILIVQRRS